MLLGVYVMVRILQYTINVNNCYICLQYISTSVLLNHKYCVSSVCLQTSCFRIEHITLLSTTFMEFSMIGNE